MRRSSNTPRSVNEADVTTFTTSPVCGASTTRPWPTNMATCPGQASVPAEPGVGTRSPRVSRDSVVTVPSRLCVDVVRLRWWPPAAHAATMRLEQSHDAHANRSKGDGGHCYLAAALQALPLHKRRKTDCRERQVRPLGHCGGTRGYDPRRCTCPAPGSASTVATSPSN